MYKGATLQINYANSMWLVFLRIEYVMKNTKMNLYKYFHKRGEFCQNRDNVKIERTKKALIKIPNIRVVERGIEII